MIRRQTNNMTVQQNDLTVQLLNGLKRNRHLSILSESVCHDESTRNAEKTWPILCFLNEILCPKQATGTKIAECKSLKPLGESTPPPPPHKNHGDITGINKSILGQFIFSVDSQNLKRGKRVIKIQLPPILLCCWCFLTLAKIVNPVFILKLRNLKYEVTSEWAQINYFYIM